MSSKRALVLGNGESRLSIDLSLLQSQYTIFGCNAIYRDFLVDYLVCCDRRMVKEVLNNDSSKKINLYTRIDSKNMFDPSGVNFLPDLPYYGLERQDKIQHWGSGPYAVLLAASIGFTDITLVGFDLYGNGKFINNVYKNTKNYQTENVPAVDPSYWIYQIGKVFEIYNHTKFNVVNNHNWKAPKNWVLPNVLFRNSLDL